MKKQILYIGLLAFLLLCTRNAHAQQTTRTARVEQIAGNVIYLNIGSDQGLSQGDTLFVYHDKSYRGSLIVISAASQMSSTKFTNQPFSLTRGELLQIRKMSNERSAGSQKTSPVQKNAPGADTTRSSNTIKQSPRRPYRIPPDITGGVQFGANVMFSSTKTANVGSEIVKRRFITTYTGLQTQIRHLPNQLSLNMNMQWDYRYASQLAIQPASAFRIFQFEVDKKFGKSPVHLSLGRFYNYYEPFSGFWDGAMLRIGNDSYGVGFISGFDPIQSDQGFSSSLPKSSFYTYFNFRKNRFYSESEISLNAVLPRTYGWNNHFYAGWHQQFRYKGSSLMSNIQIDQNPINKKYIFSQVNLRADIDLTRYLTFHGVYDRRQPYRIWQIGTPISYLRTMWTGGLSLQLGNNTIGADYTLNQSDVSRNSHTYSGYVFVPQTALLGLGFNVSADYWTDKTFKSIYASPEITKTIGHGQISLMYRFYQSQFFSRSNQTHSVGLQYNVSFAKSWYINTQILTQFGQLLNNHQFFIGISKRF